LHFTVQEINNNLEQLENNTSYVDLIDENGNISIHDATYLNLSQGFLLKAKRKRLRILKDISAYNVAKYTVSGSDVKVLKISLCLHDLVSIILDTYSGDYLSV
jgi:exonuclease I